MLGFIVVVVSLLWSCSLLCLLPFYGYARKYTVEFIDDAIVRFLLLRREVTHFHHTFVTMMDGGTIPPSLDETYKTLWSQHDQGAIAAWVQRHPRTGQPQKRFIGTSSQPQKRFIGTFAQRVTEYHQLLDQYQKYIQSIQTQAVPFPPPHTRSFEDQLVAVQSHIKNIERIRAIQQDVLLDLDPLTVRTAKERETHYMDV